MLYSRTCHTTWILLLTALIIITATISQVTRAAGPPSAKYVRGQLIVQMGAGRDGQSLVDDHASIGLRRARLLSRRLNIWLFEFDTLEAKSANMTEATQVLESVRAHPDVEVSQFNHLVTLRQAFPDDPDFSLQWGLHNSGQTGGIPDADIDAPEAWAIGTQGQTSDGDQIVVAVIDGQVDLNHPDLDLFTNVFEIPDNGLDDDQNGYIDDYIGYAVYDTTESPLPSNHATHVAGVVGATGNNALGVAGVNWNVRVLPVRGASWDEAVVIEAYSYVLDMRVLYNETNGFRGAFVVATNSSFGIDYGNPAAFPVWCAMYDSLGAHGILNAAATANLAIDVDEVGDMPTGCGSDYLIAVTTTTQDDEKLNAAATGPNSIDIGAPGYKILSTFVHTSQGEYGYLSGTSAASPHVAGAIGFLYSVVSGEVLELAKQQPDSVARLIKRTILDGADPLPSLAGVTVSGGRLNLYNSAILAKNIETGLVISHDPLPDTRDTLIAYNVSAIITSDSPLVSDSLLLHYATGATWDSLLLVPGSATSEYVAAISAQSPGTDVTYFLTALDTQGKRDTTEIWSFRVIDYRVDVFPVSDTVRRTVDDSVWFRLTITNTGVLPDAFTLSVQGNTWPCDLFDSTQANTISQTPVLAQDESYNVFARVIVPPSELDDADTATIGIQSIMAAEADSARVITISEDTAAVVPFVDQFDTQLLSNLRWHFNLGAVVNSVAFDEPSPPSSLNLNGPSDTVISRAMDLEGMTDAILRYSYERTGGGDPVQPVFTLRVDYLDATNNWVLADEYNGNGDDMTHFQKVWTSLPAAALHPGFRVRFRSSGYPDEDDWFVDDIYIGSRPDFDLEVLTKYDEGFGSAGDTAFYILSICNRGTTIDSYGLIASGGSWGGAILDQFSLAPISSLGPVAPSDTMSFRVVVPIPQGSVNGDMDSLRIVMTSFNDTSVVDSSLLVSFSTGTPSTFPWYESFPGSSLGSLWSRNVGAEVRNLADAAPSPDYALRLDGSVDTVVSRVIDLTGQSDIQLTYYYAQDTALQASPGEDLFLDFKDAVGDWITLDHVVADTARRWHFFRQTVGLPIEALHDECQIRFRSLGGYPGIDGWYVDDIRIDSPPHISIVSDSLHLSMLQNKVDFRSLMVGNSGSGALTYSIGVLPGVQEGVSRRPHSWFDGNRPRVPNRQLAGISNQFNSQIITSGGPDAGGYYWISSDHEVGPSFEWIDISATGTNITSDVFPNLQGGPYGLGFQFPYYDSLCTYAYVGENGLVGFYSYLLWLYIPDPIPWSYGANSMIALLWQNLTPWHPNNPGVGGVYFDTSPERCVIQFQDCSAQWSAPGQLVSAEVVIYPTGLIRLNYLGFAGGFETDRCAIGIENHDGTSGLQVAYMEPYLRDSMSIVFDRPSRWLYRDSIPRVVSPGATDTMEVAFVSLSLPTGTYTADIYISSNDTASDTVHFPVSLTVLDQLPGCCAGIAGNVNGDAADAIDVSDLTYMVSYMFKSGPEPPCPEEADVTGGGSVDIADLTQLVGYMFKSGPSPVACP